MANSVAKPSDKKRRFFEPRRNSLIDIHLSGSAEEYWDMHWKTTAGDQQLAAIHTPNKMVMRVTQRYLAPGTRVLEGGCGLGQNVWGLECLGYQSWGIDNAEDTVLMVSKLAPDLKISLGDVQHLEFPDAHFDGYWSLGVIEHFWDGYSNIVEEMKRVIKPGGYLFLTFPAMNPARYDKAKAGRYPLWTDTVEARFRQDFYQFVLPVDEVESVFHISGFQTIERKYLDGYKGVKDELALARQIITVLSRVGLGRFVQKMMNLLLSRRYGHVVLLVLKRD